MKGWSLDQLPPGIRDQAAQQLGADHAKSKRRSSKYNAQATYVDGIRFPSKREADWYSKLKLLQRAGEIRHFHRQVIFDLPGSTTHRVDFMLVMADGTVRYQDAKGVDHADGRLRRRQIADLYGVEIELV